MQHSDVGPTPERAPRRGAQAIASARELLGTHLPTSRLQRVDQAAHAMPIGRLLQTMPQQHDIRHCPRPYAVSARCASAFSAMSMPVASFNLLARCANAARADSSRKRWVAARTMLGAANAAVAATPALPPPSQPAHLPLPHRPAKPPSP